MFNETITYATDKVKNTWQYLETVMPATYNELNDVVMKLVANNNALIADIINPLKEKPGVVKLYAGAVAPSGYFLCQGQAVSRTTYSALFAIIGTIYGEGDGSTTFSLPDTRGLFVRGVGGNSGALGAVQGDAIRNITGTIGADDKATRIATGAFSAEQQVEKDTSSQGGDGSFFKFTFDASRVVPTAVENRPVNMAMNYIIKY